MSEDALEGEPVEGGEIRVSLTMVDSVFDGCPRSLSSCQSKKGLSIRASATI